MSKAKLIFLNEIARQLADLKKAQEKTFQQLTDVREQLGRRRKFRAVPDWDEATPRAWSGK